MIIIVAKELGKLNPIDYSAEVSHALKTRLKTLTYTPYLTRILNKTQKQHVSIL